MAILCLLAVVITSIWRAALRIRYEVWQWLHLVLSTVAITAALVHVELIGHYVNQPWKRGLWVLMTAGFLCIFLWVRVARPVLRTRRPWTVASVVSERGGVSTITLHPIGHNGFRFAPGQFGWLSAHRSPFALTQHPFSFSSNGDEPAALQMSIKELGDFTRTVGSIAPGTRAYVDGPHGVFSPDRYAGPGFVFLAGGVGIAPVMSMLRTFAARGELSPCYLFFGRGPGPIQSSTQPRPASSSLILQCGRLAQGDDSAIPARSLRAAAAHKPWSASGLRHRRRRRQLIIAWTMWSRTPRSQLAVGRRWRGGQGSWMQSRTAPRLP